MLVTTSLPPRVVHAWLVVMSNGGEASRCSGYRRGHIRGDSSITPGSRKICESLFLLRSTFVAMVWRQVLHSIRTTHFQTRDLYFTGATVDARQMYWPKRCHKLCKQNLCPIIALRATYLFMISYQAHVLRRINVILFRSLAALGRCT